MQAYPYTRTVVILLLLGLLAGCGTAPSKTTDMLSNDPELALARQAVARQDYLQAAQHYLSLSARARGRAQAHYRLLAADYQFKSGNLEAGRVSLQTIDKSSLAPRDSLLLRLMEAEDQLAHHRHDEAISLLAPPAPETTTNPLLQRLYSDRALAYQYANQPLLRVRALEQLDALTDTSEQRLKIQLDILRTVLMAGPQLQVNDETEGWIQLAMIATDLEMDPGSAYALWRERFPGHPALPELVQSFQEDLASLQITTEHIAVMLPETGRYETAASAIRNGIIAHWYQAPSEQRPELRFYDSSDSDSAWPLYQQAVQDGAQVIIGPLQKESVLQLARAGTLEVPVLALNHVQLDGPVPENLFQFALSPEDEAIQAAQLAWEWGNTNALILYPENAWGQRLADAFSNQLQRLGGTMSVSKAYDPEGPDYSAAIKSALLLNQSIARNAEIQRLLGTRLEFNPRRRADVNLIFLIAKQRQARQIKPQLQFYYAGDLPVLSTSAAWNGTLSHQQSLDVAGLWLADIPWFLDENPEDPLTMDTINRLFPDSKSGLGRLYAMGMDSYQLLPRLRLLAQNPQETADGRTGTLYMDRLHQVHRLLVWAQLGESIKVLGYSRRPLEQEFAPQPRPETE